MELIKMNTIFESSSPDGTPARVSGPTCPPCRARGRAWAWGCGGASCMPWGDGTVSSATTLSRSTTPILTGKAFFSS